MRGNMAKYVALLKKDYLKVIRDEVKKFYDEVENNGGEVRLSKVISLLRRIKGLDRYFMMMSKVAPDEKERKAYAELAEKTAEIYGELNRIIMTSPGSKAVLTKHVRDKMKELIGKIDDLVKKSGEKFNLNVYVPEGVYENIEEKRKNRSSGQANTAQQANATQQALQQLQQTIAQAEVQAQEQMQAQEQKKRSRKKKQEATVSA